MENSRDIICEELPAMTLIIVTREVY